MQRRPSSKITQVIKPPRLHAAGETLAARYRLRGLGGRLIAGIGAEIVAGQRPPGSMVREDDVIASYGASRVSVREAIKVLAAKGLVETRQRTGTRVLERSSWNIFDPDVLAWHDLDAIDSRFLAELIELRLIIEPAAAGLAASRADPADVAQLRRAHDAMRSSVHDMERYAQADVTFHMAALAAARNSLLQRFAHTIASFLQASFRVQQQSLRPEQSLEEDCALHGCLLDAVAAGKSGAAERIMRQVILDGQQSLERARDICLLLQPRADRT